MEAESPAPVPLPAGPMAIHADGTLLGTGALDTTLPGDDLVLSLGVDEGVSVTWTQKERRRESGGGLIQRRTRMHYAYEVEVRNRRGHPVELAFLDRVPVSQDERISVRILEKPRDAEAPDDEGMVRWKQTLAPRTESTHTISFSIEYPRDLTIIGLE